MNSALDKAIMTCQSVISLPEVYQQISIKIEQPHTTHHELAELVKLDPGVSSKLLGIVNSAFYGFSGQISSISHAISLVGLNDFKNLVLSSSLVQLFDELKETTFSLHDFWNHSLLTAILAKKIGPQWLSKREQEPLFIAGLLHDVGKLVMLQTQATHIDNLATVWAENNLAAEQEIVGFNHAMAGAGLIRAWELPELLALSAEQHHQLDADKQPAIISLVVYLANAIAIGESGDIERALTTCNAHVESPLSMEEIEELKAEAESEKNSLIGLFLSP